jgi:hypothetical protein
MILVQRAVKNSLVMNFTVSGKEVIALSIPYKMSNLQFGLLRLDIEEMYIAEANLSLHLIPRACGPRSR